MTFGLKELIMAGGFILIVLVAISVYSIAIIIERWKYYGRNLRSISALKSEVLKHLRSGNTAKAAEICKHSQTPTGAILIAAMEAQGNRAERMESAGRAIEFHATALHKGLPALATIGSTCPFIGLFGTVVGVMRAFKDLSVNSGPGPSAVAAGIAEALVNTAAGLFVAIPAVFAYNYYISRANKYTTEMEWACEEVVKEQMSRQPESSGGDDLWKPAAHKQAAGAKA